MGSTASGYYGTTLMRSRRAREVSLSSRVALGGRQGGGWRVLKSFGGAGAKSWRAGAGGEKAPAGTESWEAALARGSVVEVLAAMARLLAV